MHVLGDASSEVGCCGLSGWRMLELPTLLASGFVSEG